MSFSRSTDDIKGSGDAELSSSLQSCSLGGFSVIQVCSVMGWRSVIIDSYVRVLRPDLLSSWSRELPLRREAAALSDERQRELFLGASPASNRRLPEH